MSGVFWLFYPLKIYQLTKSLITLSLDIAVVHIVTFHNKGVSNCYIKICQFHHHHQQQHKLRLGPEDVDDEVEQYPIIYLIFLRFDLKVCVLFDTIISSYILCLIRIDWFLALYSFPMKNIFHSNIHCNSAVKWV